MRAKPEAYDKASPVLLVNMKADTTGGIRSRVVTAAYAPNQETLRVVERVIRAWQTKE